MNDHITEEAAIWHQALRADDADWEGFTAWLEADPAHRGAYDAVALIDDALDRHRERLGEALSAENEEKPALSRRHWMVWTGGAVAAALALFVAVPMINTGAPASADYRTVAGQTREIALVDGSQIILGPASHLSVSGAQQERMQLEGGAWFDIRHDPGRQLIITAGEHQISDIGTKFDVLALPGHIRIAVAQGNVSVFAANNTTKPVKLSAGRSLTIDRRAHIAQVANADAQDMGGWRDGQLVYNNAPLSLVAADVSRYVGREVRVSPDLRDRRFSGVLKAGNGADLVTELGNLMELQTKREGRGFRLVARHR